MTGIHSTYKKPRRRAQLPDAAKWALIIGAVFFAWALICLTWFGGAR